MKNKRKKETAGQEACWLKFAISDTSLEEGTFKGMASVFGSLVQSWMPTVIEPGAFTKTLQENFARIKVLWQHDSWCPIGLPTKLIETQLGLEVEGKISQTEYGKDALILLRDGVIDELSIGFDPIKWEMEDKGDGNVVRHIKEVRLWEISLVTFAADPLARIQAVHSQDGSLESLLEELLASVPLEAHEGKVLSTKNKKLLQDAVAALQALIAAAEPPEKKDEDQALTVNAEQLRKLGDVQLWLAQHP